MLVSNFGYVVLRTIINEMVLGLASEQTHLW